MSPGPTERALATALICSVGYVAAIYGPSDVRKYPRNHPIALRARLSATIVYTVIVLLYGVGSGQLQGLIPADWDELWSCHIVGTFRSLIFTGILFLGPLLYHLPGLPALDMATARDLIVGPISEEIVYRGLMAPLVGYWNSAFFSLSHAHHGVISYQHGVPLKTALLSSFAQLSMTSMFALYATFIFIRTGSVWASFAVHAFCNFMGPPTISGPTLYRVLLLTGLATFLTVIRFL